MKTERGYSGVNPTTCVVLSSIAAGIHLSECCSTDTLTVPALCRKEAQSSQPAF